MSTLNVVDSRAAEDSRILDADKRCDCPPVVILNMFYSGLGIARDLAGRGVRVIGLSADHKVYGNSTRLCEVRFAPNSQENPEELAEFLLRSNNDLWGAVIFPTRDADVLFLERFRSELEPRYRLAIPPSRCLRRTINKYELALAAREAGVPVPRTIQVSSAEELIRVPNEVGFPCVLKPVSSFQWRLGDAWDRVGCRKAFRVDDFEMLRREYDQISEVTPQVLVQEWIAGGVGQIVVLGGYVNEASRLLSYFTARKLLQSPDDFGTGCIVQSEVIPAIVEPTRRLFCSLEYQGMAEVEYKQDSETGEYKLIEVNTRHWDQHELGRASGINLTWVAYCDLTGKDPPQGGGPIVRTKWIAEDALLIQLVRSIVHAELRTPHLGKMLSGPRTYGIFAAKDPLPFFCYLFGTLLPGLAKTVLVRLKDTLRRPSCG
jgi:D-aspartate ligase